MKKTKAAALALAGITLLSGTTAFGAEKEQKKITVKVDGVEIQFDQEPVNVDNRVMVPVRFVAEAMDWDVDYDFVYGKADENGNRPKEYFAAMTKKITRKKTEITYKTTIWLGSNKIEGECSGDNLKFTNFNGDLVAPSVVLNGRTLLGVRDIAEGLYAKVDWDSATKTVEIKTKPDAELPHYSEMIRNTEG